MTRHKIGDKWIEVGFNDQDVDEIKSRTPVKTGAAQRGWTIEAITGDIINLVFYIVFLEFGTIKMAGFFMVQRSLPAIMDRISRDIARQLGEGPQPLFKLPEIVIQI